MPASSVPITGRPGTVPREPAPKTNPLRDAVLRAAQANTPEAKALRDRIASRRRELGIR